MDGPRIAKHLLAGPVRTLFTKPHPMLDTTTTRAAHRPFGGSDAQADFQDAESQPWKAQAGWGCYNLLAWCVSLLPGEDIEANIGLILPPTLTMMDDWEAPWRGRGVFVLNAWIEKVDLVWMKRMGMDRLLLASLLHTLQLHTNPPLPQVLPTALRLIERTMEGKKKADTLAEVVDKALLSGWIYAPSGTEGRPVLVHIAQELELMCDALGTGITRWLKVCAPSSERTHGSRSRSTAAYHSAPPIAPPVHSDSGRLPALYSQPLRSFEAGADGSPDGSSSTMAGPDPPCPR